MSYLSSCLGFRSRKADDHEPLLPQYNDETTLQRRLHQKLHTYQQLRALSHGYLPTTEQAIINLRTLLASDVLNQDNPDLSESGRRLVKFTRQWLHQFIELLRSKNGEDQIQDLLWYLRRSRVSVDVDDLAARAKKSKAKADTAALYESVKTVGSLMFMSNDFRTFLADLNVVGREVFRDSAFKLSEVAEEAGKKIEPTSQEQQTVKQPGADQDVVASAPSGQQLGEEVVDVTKVVAEEGTEVAKTAVESAKDRLSGDEGKTLLNRLKQTIFNLRERKDYSQSVSTISLLIQRYALVYSRAAGETLDVAAKDTQQNEALNRAAKNAWMFITSFGEEKEWKNVEEGFEKVMEHREKDPEFESMMMEVGESVQKMLTDPSFFDEGEPKKKFDELREKSEEIGNEDGRSLKDDVNALLVSLERAFKSVLHDEQIHQLIQTSLRLVSILSPAKQATNPELLQDSVNVFLPLLISAVQYVPIPRVEVSTPALDLLLENLILEPGSTINQSSFLPYRLKVETYNDVDIYKTHTLSTATKMTNLVTIKLDGLSLRADEVGYILRLHSGLLRLNDEGLVSFALDQRGLDIHVDVEIARERMEQILTLKGVRVHVHKLNYTLRQSKLSWLVGFILKPLLRPIIRKTLERQVATALTDLFHTANRELLYARERLRATRVSDPDDLITFVKAVAARLTPEEDPDVYSRIGVKAPAKGTFKNVYAPGSLVKVWDEEGRKAGERIEDNEINVGGWKNDIFDNNVTVNGVEGGGLLY